MKSCNRLLAMHAYPKKNLDESLLESFISEDMNEYE